MKVMKQLFKAIGRLSSFYRWSVLLYLGVLCFIIPWNLVFSFEPSTGGDVGSHFYPIYAMKESLSIRPWSPGNLAGEPLLVHYFPLPFMIMAGLSLLLPAGLAFNWIYIISVFLIPFAIYYYLKKIKVPGYGAEFSFLLALIFIFNTSFTAWGGNLSSTLAGQFCHAYALVFFFMFLGVMNDEIRKKELISLRGAFLVSAIILSHAYIALSLPIAAVSILIVANDVPLKEGLKKIIFTGLFGTAISLWWIVPFLTNNAWTTPYESSWMDSLNLFSYFPLIFFIPSIAGSISLISLLSNPTGRAQLVKQSLKYIFALLVLVVFYFFLIKIFPLIGLVDIRAIPQVQLFIGIIIGILLGLWLDLAPRRVRPYLEAFSLGLVFVIIFIPAKSNVESLRWNWSGWTSKVGYTNFKKINDALRGNFSMPRVAFESSESTAQAGTSRAFEMLPYFSGRATNESLYMQATSFAPLVFYFEALLGKDKSCPYPQVPCPEENLQRAIELMPFLGVKDLILVSPESKLKADGLADLENTLTAEPWGIYQLKKEVSLVEVSSGQILEASPKDWKTQAINYTIKYNKDAPWVYVDHWTSQEVKTKLKKEVSQIKECHPEVNLTWNLIKLKTDCPGIPHIIKTAFHPSFMSSSGDDLFLVLPGYTGIIPSVNDVELKFGQTADWYISRWISLLTILYIAVLATSRRLKSLTKKN